jgi:hypothetical protein
VTAVLSAPPRGATDQVRTALYELQTAGVPISGSEVLFGGRDREFVARVRRIFGVRLLLRSGISVLRQGRHTVVLIMQPRSFRLLALSVVWGTHATATVRPYYFAARVRRPWGYRPERAQAVIDAVTDLIFRQCVPPTVEMVQ